MKRENANKYSSVLAATMIPFMLSVFTAELSRAVIQGPCADCHTMHNSQGGGAMTFDDTAAPNAQLLRGTCLSCHAIEGGAYASPTYDLGTDSIPLVMHAGGTDLAAGNFRYIDTDGSNHGHNISGLTADEASPLMYPPPGIIGPGTGPGGGDRHATFWDSHQLSCISSDENGTAGCHGLRQVQTSLPEGITGAHHNNGTGSLATADTVGSSYRFLMGVMGYEDPGWEEDIVTGHNEYFGRTTPISLGCGTGNCHTGGNGPVSPPDGTMSQLCASCHGNFHTLGTTDYDGVGPAPSSPFIRHPTDLALPAVGEYAAYTAYSNQAPVARTSGVPGGPVASVTPGTDAVMCLSCHRAHASEYPDMLRWDYTTMIAGEGIGNTDGCFVCHTTKN